MGIFFALGQIKGVAHPSSQILEGLAGPATINAVPAVVDLGICLLNDQGPELGLVPWAGILGPHISAAIVVVCDPVVDDDPLPAPVLAPHHSVDAVLNVGEYEKALHWLQVCSGAAGKRTGSSDEEAITYGTLNDVIAVCPINKQSGTWIHVLCPHCLLGLSHRAVGRHTLWVHGITLTKPETFIEERLARALACLLYGLAFLDTLCRPVVELPGNGAGIILHQVGLQALRPRRLPSGHSFPADLAVGGFHDGVPLAVGGDSHLLTTVPPVLQGATAHFGVRPTAPRGLQVLHALGQPHTLLHNLGCYNGLGTFAILANVAVEDFIQNLHVHRVGDLCSGILLRNQNSDKFIYKLGHPAGGQPFTGFLIRQGLRREEFF
mmetsp:Transcript_69317/g.122381  ORF Transcript_69317/g.122381 Transcript_69317/m.122381 type:complete len:379 (-) Transcript_69317:59-1195(-)